MTCSQGCPDFVTQVNTQSPIDSIIEVKVSVLARVFLRTHSKGTSFLLGFVDAAAVQLGNIEENTSFFCIGTLD